MRGNRINVTLKDDLFSKLVEDAKYHGVPLATMVNIALNKYYSGYTVQMQQVQVHDPVNEEKEDIKIEMNISEDDKEDLLNMI